MFLPVFNDCLRVDDRLTILRGRRSEATATSYSAIDSEAMKQFEMKKKTFGSEIDKRLERDGKGDMLIKISGAEGTYKTSHTAVGNGSIRIPR